MNTDKNVGPLRSKKIEKILNEDPPWILRWGSLILFILFVVAGIVIYILGK